MAKSEKQKLKLLYIIQCLMEKTDEEHAVTTQEIIDYLALQGITAERKSIYTDIDLLIDFGMDIIKKPGRSGGYTLASRQFELAELKLLVDAVQSSKFITTKKSRELIGKLETLCSKYEATQLHRQVVVTNRNKAVNENILSVNAEFLCSLYNSFCDFKSSLRCLWNTVFVKGKTDNAGAVFLYKR